MGIVIIIFIIIINYNNINNNNLFIYLFIYLAHNLSNSSTVSFISKLSFNIKRIINIS
jgi:hypothetical protein